MHFSRQLASVAAAALPLLAGVRASCNPLESTSCDPDTALGTSIDVDFTEGSVNSFSASGTPTYGDDGVTFTIAESGDAPQLASVFYIMFGHVDFTVKPAPGAGIVSSLVLMSDDEDEIDMEWLGTDDSEVQTNYFGKGQTTTYNRGEFNAAADNQASFITYSIDWTAARIVWSVAGTVVRTLTYDDAETDQYPQTPMQVKFGAWAGGDTATNAEGTVEWARGPTNFSDGPFSMVVSGISVTDYSTGTEYVYLNQSGDWQSIEAVGGSVGINAGSVTYTATATAATGTSLDIPLGGMASAIATESVTIPSGWVMTSTGKMVPSSASPISPPQLVIMALQLCGCLALGAALVRW